MDSNNLRFEMDRAGGRKGSSSKNSTAAATTAAIILSVSLKILTPQTWSNTYT